MHAFKKKQRMLNLCNITSMVLVFGMRKITKNTEYLPGIFEKIIDQCESTQHPDNISFYEINLCQ